MLKTIRIALTTSLLALSLAAHGQAAPAL